MELLKINTQLVSEILQQFLKEEVRKAGFSRVVLGLSGGIDSSVVAFLTLSVSKAKFSGNWTKTVSPPTLNAAFSYSVNEGTGMTALNFW